MKKIKLSRGLFAKVDEEDFEYLNQFKWHALKGNTTFYAQRDICKNKSVLMHREIMKTPKGKVTDHINHNGLDNRKKNLRICTAQENSCNRRLQKNASSKYKCVIQHCITQKWRAYIRYKKQSIYLGVFNSEKEAALAYNKAAKELFGKFAFLNKISK